MRTMGMPRPANLHTKKKKRMVYAAIAVTDAKEQSPLVPTEGRTNQ
jgi:hypothetical protein